MSDRQKLFLALLASALFHLALGVVLASWTDRHSSVAERARPDLSQLTVTIMPVKPEEAAHPAPMLPAAPTPAPVMPVLDSDGLTRSAKAPAHPVFQSDSNMAAGSLLPAAGNIPMPSQNGPVRKNLEPGDQAASLGKGETPAEAARARQAAEAAHSTAEAAREAAEAARQAAQATHEAAQVMPEQTPFAVTQVQHSPAPPPQATPQPAPKPKPTAAPDMLALGTPTPTPAPALPQPTPVELARLTMPPPLLRGHAYMAPMAQPEEETPPSPPMPREPEPSTQRQLTRTRIDGGITTHGRPGVDAIETPFGRYHRKLSNLIGSRWQLYLQEHPKDVGDVTILVKLDTNGRVVATRVVANHSMDDLAELSTRAIMESDLPPVPDDLAPMLRDGKLEITFNFNVYDPNNDSSGR